MSSTDLAGEQVTPIQKGTKEARHCQRYGDVMRLHEAAPKLIIQERLGDKVKVLSYWPVPELTRAELALGRLQPTSSTSMKEHLTTKWRSIQKKRPRRGKLTPFVRS